MGSIFKNVGSMFKTLAFQLEKSGRVAILIYLTVVYAFLADMMLFGETFLFLEVVGAIIIVSLNVGMTILQFYQDSKSDPY